MTRLQCSGVCERAAPLRAIRVAGRVQPTVAPWPPPCLLGQCGACPSRVLTDLRLRCGPAGPIIRRRLSCVPCPGRFAVLFQVLPAEALGALLPFKFKFGPILTLSPTCVEVLSSRPSAVLGVGAPPPPTSPDKTKHTDRRELWQVQRFCQTKRRGTHSLAGATILSDEKAWHTLFTL